MIRSLVRRVVAVIRRNDQQIVILHQLKHLRQAGIVFLKRLTVAFRIAPMTIDSIEVHQIYKG
ncbi:hypothetical protein D3C77_616320 [compost metagenome]